MIKIIGQEIWPYARHLAKKLIYSMKLSQDNYSCTFIEILFSDRESSSSVKAYKLTESFYVSRFPEVREEGWGMAPLCLDQRRFTPVPSHPPSNHA